MKLTPLADRVLLKITVNKQQTTKSGIILADAAQEKTEVGEVIAIGEGTKDDPIKVKIGQKVMFDKYSGTKIKIEGEDHLLIKMQDVVAIVE